MDWEHETYRRLYVRRDARWVRHPLSTRGLADELLVYADEDGCLWLADGEEPVDCIMRVTQAHTGERDRVLADMNRLLQGNSKDPAYMLIDDSERVIRIRNFHAAQGIIPVTAAERSEQRSASAIRAARWRADKRSERTANASANASANAKTNAGERLPNAHTNAEKTSGERETERQANAGERLARGDAPAGASPGDAREGTLPSCPSLPSGTHAPTGAARLAFETMRRAKWAKPVADTDLYPIAIEVGALIDKPEIDPGVAADALADASDCAAKYLRAHAEADGLTCAIEFKRKVRFKYGAMVADSRRRREDRRDGSDDDHEGPIACTRPDIG